MKNTIKTIYTILLVLMVWYALGLQFYIAIEKNFGIGWSVLRSVIFILSYYTIQTNLLIAVALTSILVKPNSAWGRFFSRVSVLTAIAVYIIIVGLVYATVLKGLVKLEGLFITADYLLHTLSPIFYTLFWLLFVPKQNIKWGKIFPWAMFPLLYLGYSLVRGLISGEYPYPFINATKIGYNQVYVNSFFILMVFLVLSLVFISVSRILAKSESK